MAFDTKAYENLKNSLIARGSIRNQAAPAAAAPAPQVYEKAQMSDMARAYTPPAQEAPTPWQVSDREAFDTTNGWMGVARNDSNAAASRDRAFKERQYADALQLERQKLMGTNEGVAPMGRSAPEQNQARMQASAALQSKAAAMNAQGMNERQYRDSRADINYNRQVASNQRYQADLQQQRENHLADRQFQLERQQQPGPYEKAMMRYEDRRRFDREAGIKEDELAVQARIADTDAVYKMMNGLSMTQPKPYSPEPRFRG